MIICAEVELFLYNCQSLKDKRSVLLRMKNRLRKELNISIAETDHQNLWQRATISIVTVSESKEIAEKVIQQALTKIDSFTELEITTTVVEER
ncbi:DUF503 domain-containing protein [Gracilibacillus sp. YIM 98692]|uniref:DUF503 domain-containing protein n=1 Tax=Gracilibacillus sp. YIM 98692 TaxID=2663532 RepID=UPI0013D7CECA|nr:DUF503 domain-containing protein [Gracilibacillus sp. YIM 98692]